MENSDKRLVTLGLLRVVPLLLLVLALTAISIIGWLSPGDNNTPDPADTEIRRLVEDLASPDQVLSHQAETKLVEMAAENPSVAKSLRWALLWSTGKSRGRIEQCLHNIEVCHGQ